MCYHTEREIQRGAWHNVDTNKGGDGTCTQMSMPGIKASIVFALEADIGTDIQRSHQTFASDFQ
jgi:hypothetical protein